MAFMAMLNDQMVSFTHFWGPRNGCPATSKKSAWSPTCPVHFSDLSKSCRTFQATAIKKIEQGCSRIPKYIYIWILGYVQATAIEVAKKTIIGQPAKIHQNPPRSIKIPPKDMVGRPGSGAPASLNPKGVFKSLGSSINRRMCAYIYIYIHIYIYIYRERERGREMYVYVHVCVCVV